VIGLDVAILGLSYSAGLLATMAPCALPMLPGYVAYYMNVGGGERGLSRGVASGLVTVSGFLTVFLLIGLLPSFAVHVVAERIDLVRPFIGLFLVMMGLLTGFSEFFYRFPSVETVAPKKAGFSSLFVYGLGYGAASLACSFPLFILLVLQSATGGGSLSIVASFLAYGAGSATVLVPLTLAVTYSKEFIISRLLGFLPRVKKISSLVLVAAGAYMIVYTFLY
jgi:cytochrome c-type biogenesis protein